MNNICKQLTKLNIFVSHTHRDKNLVQRLNQEIRKNFKNSIKLFISSDPQNSTSPGEDWEKDIYKNIIDSDLMFVLITSNSKDSKWMNDEILLAQSQQKLIIPIRINCKCKIPNRITSIQAIEDSSNYTDDFTPELFKLLKKFLSDRLESKKQDERIKKRNEQIFATVTGPYGVVLKKILKK